VHPTRGADSGQNVMFQQLGDGRCHRSKSI